MMNREEFVEKHCKMCGTQRCEGIGTEWFDGCHYRNELDGYEEDIKHKLDLEEILRAYNEYLKATKDKSGNYTTTAIGTGENIVDRDYLDKVMKKYSIDYNYGWICPRCGKVLAPDVKECNCKPEPNSNINNPFYNTIKPSGYCPTGRKYTSCPKTPNYDSCHFCSKL